MLDCLRNEQKGTPPNILQKDFEVLFAVHLELGDRVGGARDGKREPFCPASPAGSGDSPALAWFLEESTCLLGTIASLLHVGPCTALTSTRGKMMSSGKSAV